MFVRFIALGAMASATAASTFEDIPVNSKLGSKLLSKARQLKNDDDAYGYTWVMDYSLKFDSCHQTRNYRADAGRNSGDEEEEPYESEQWVHFRLCPSNSCGWCRKGGDYLVEMREFMETYFEYHQNIKEKNCETLKENCVCNDDAGDDQNCFQQCYTDAGMDYCAEYDSADGNDDDGNFDINEYLECREVDENDDDSNSLYVGPTCSANGKNIYLGEFTNRECTKKAKSGSYKALTGKSLPYTSKSMISNDCISCLEPAENDDDNNGDGISEICEDLYERSSKCERNMQIDYRLNNGCEYIFKMLPQYERIGKRAPSASTVFAWLFFLSTIVAGAYAVLLYRRLKRTQVSLASQAHGEAA